MPNYVKFLKDVMSKKRKMTGFETVNLTEECSAIIQRKLPQKLKDPGSFTIHCAIGDVFFKKALCDLGASINLMPLSIFRQLGLGEVKPSTVTLQLADRSLTYPKGIIEDVLVKVDKFIFPMDFLVLDMEEDRDVSLILGSPFLAMGKALIDVQNGEITLRVNDEHVLFTIYKALQFHDGVETCNFIDVVESCIDEYADHTLFRDDLEFGLTHSCSTSNMMIDYDNQDLYDCVYETKAEGPKDGMARAHLHGQPVRPSDETISSLELKPLPEQLRYAFLGANNKSLVIVSSLLTSVQLDKLLRS
ncbi:hypothetical protein DH2020_021320 [Rehmannia glutinosa]|uniref:Aspartic peptidase DDI1-type domain-containing protein n=1 Tax=Rehmannia glutinosa TaxID=99300 RepID=A0ABR0WBJ3_REHGL